MNKILIILFVFGVVSASDLDSLIVRSGKASRESHMLKGFIISRSIGGGKIITPTILKFPEQLFKHFDNTSYDSLNIRLAVLEAKVSTVLGNIQDQTDSNTKKSEFILKLIEIVGGFIGALAALLGAIPTIIALRKKA